MKTQDLGIQKSFLQRVTVGDPNFKNYYPLRKLFGDYLNKLNVAFYDECCPAQTAPNIFPLRFNSDTAQVEFFDGAGWNPAGGGGGSRFAIVGEDDNAAEERAFAMNNHSFSIGGGTQYLLQFDTTIIGSKIQGAMFVADWSTTAPRLQLGDLGNWNKNTVLTLDDDLQLLEMNLNSGLIVLTIDGANEIYRLGKPNTTTFEMNNTNALIRMWSGTGLWFLISGTGGSGIVRLGDMNNTANSTIAQLTDNAGTFDLSSVGLPPAYSIQGTPGATGSFTAQSGETITVTGGIITAITP